MAHDHGGAEPPRHVELGLVVLDGVDDGLGDLLGGHRLRPFAVIRMTSGLAEVAAHRARIHDGHADAIGLHFNRERLGEAHACELGRGIDRLER